MQTVSLRLLARFDGIDAMRCGQGRDGTVMALDEWESNGGEVCEKEADALNEGIKATIAGVIRDGVVVWLVRGWWLVAVVQWSFTGGTVHRPVPRAGRYQFRGPHLKLRGLSPLKLSHHLWSHAHTVRSLLRQHCVVVG